MTRLCSRAILAMALLALPAVAPPSAQAGGNPYCPRCGGGSTSPQEQYQQYQSTIGQQNDSSSGRLFLSPGSSSSGKEGGAQPFYLQGILNNPTSTKYGMHYSVSTPPQPFSMNGSKGEETKTPTVADLQAMAQKDQDANLKSALAESADRTRQIKEMQEEWAKHIQEKSVQAQGTAASGTDTQKPNIKYVYKKGNPTKVSTPPRVFLDNR